METSFKRAKALRVALLISRILLALLLLSGAVMKWLPIEQISETMPWTGELPEIAVRLLGVVDLLGAIGLLVPGMLGWNKYWTVAAAVGVAALMVSAIVFHVIRGEVEVIGINIFAGIVALFVAWGTNKAANNK
jgi:uncharacterized membrane protein